MGCSGSKATKVQDQDINARISSTRREITRIEADMQSCEYELNEMKKRLQVTPSNSNSVKEDEFKNKLVNKIKEYKRLTNRKKVLENNLEVMQRKKEEAKVVAVLDENNMILGDNDNNNADKINENINNVNMQNQQLDLNDRLFEQAGNDGQNKYERDAYINNFFNNY